MAKGSRIVGGRWKLSGRVLTEGGQGQIHIAVDKSGQVAGDVVLKLLKNMSRTDRLVREIETTKQLHASGAPVLQILDDFVESETEASRPWYVAPLFEDGDLSRFIKGRGEEGDLLQALEIFSEVLAAVASVHEHGVAHRDLKPANILLHGQQVVLADFGLCLPLYLEEGDRLTEELERIGSIHYTPPEAYVRQPTGQDQYAFDAYALGKILYELVSGQVLPFFTHPSEGKYDLTEKFEGLVYKDLNRVLRGLLHEKPEVRLATLAELQEQMADIRERIDGVRETPSSTKLNLNLAEARESLARLVRKSPEVAVKDEEVSLLLAEVRGVLEETQAVRSLIETFEAEAEPVVQFQRSPSDGKLRSILASPVVRTKKAIEPLEDEGYPSRPAEELGFAVGLTPIKEWKSQLPELWLGALVARDEEDLWLAIGVVRSETGAVGRSDLVDDTVVVMRVDPHAPSDVSRARSAAEASAAAFAEMVVKEIAKITP